LKYTKSTSFIEDVGYRDLLEVATLGMLARQPVKIPKAAAVVAARIRSSIIRGEFQPDHALPNETELMDVYEVSRPVVREALRVLESESLINVKRGVGGGARVRRPDIGVAARHTALLLQLEGATMEDLFEARKILEPEAVRRLATVRSKDAIARLRKRNEEEMALLDDLTEYPIAAALFHAELIELAGNKTMAILGRLLLEIVETHNRRMFTVLQGEGAQIARDAAECSHSSLIDMIEAGEVEQAVKHWERHVQEAADLAIERLGPATVIDLLDHEFNDVRPQRK